METYRLKNIAILILLLLNGGLLLLLGYQHLHTRRTQADAAGQLRALCESHQLTISARVELDQEPLSPLSLSRNDAVEQEIAGWLLGGSASASSQGGGIYSYAAENGIIQFRSGGGFDGSHLKLRVEDIPDFCQRFCQRYGYEDLQLQNTGQSWTAAAMQQVAGVPIYGCGVTLEFEDGVLSSVTGAHVSLDGAAVEPGQTMTCITALLRFLDHRNASGIVCNTVEDAQCVYRLQSTASSLRLLPAWRIVTDTGAYFVDCSSGELTRE